VTGLPPLPVLAALLGLDLDDRPTLTISPSWPICWFVWSCAALRDDLPPPPPRIRPAG
jgi:hypothetical protein